MINCAGKNRFSVILTTTGVTKTSTLTQILSLNENTAIEIVADINLDLIPYFNAESLTIELAPYNNAEEYAIFNSTNLSNMNVIGYSPDKLYFDTSNKILSGAVLHTNPYQISDSNFIEYWISLDEAIGLPKLRIDKPFPLNPNIKTYYSLKYDYLFSLASEEINPLADSLKLKIAPNTFLLFSNNTLSGWLLEQPWQFLLSKPPKTMLTEDPATVKLIFATFFRLLSNARVDRMLEQDKQIFSELIEFTKILHGYPDNRFMSLESTIKRLLEDFYNYP